MDPAKLVLNIEAAGASEVRAMDQHERKREPDGTSAIDPLRSHLNEVLHGPVAGPSAALRAVWAAGVKRPNVQAEKPYLRLVVSASPSYFRDPGEGPGTWNPQRLADFQREVMTWMQERFGDDLVFASVHLDEDTPHIHALIVPTYERKPRTPGKQKRGETVAQFEARKAAAKAAVGVRTVGRSSHPVLSRKGSFDTMRHSLADHLAPLGIIYGDQLHPDQSAKTTRAWVKEQAVKVAAEKAALAAEREAMVLEREAIASERENLEAQQKAMAAEREAMLAEKAANLDKAKGWVERIKVERADLATERAQLVHERAELEADRAALAGERAQVRGLVRRLGALIERVETALVSVLQLGPRVRRILGDAEATPDERHCARQFRSEIVKSVPTLRETRSFLTEAHAAAQGEARSAPEQAREQISLDRQDWLDDLDGPG